MCNVSYRDLPRTAQQPPRTFAFKNTDSAGPVIYADPVNGKDSNAGTEASPLRSIEAALKVVRAAKGPGTIVLRSGIFYITDTIALTAADSGLTIKVSARSFASTILLHIRFQLHAKLHAIHVLQLHHRLPPAPLTPHPHPPSTGLPRGHS